MATCENCAFYFPVPENADDYEHGKGDCVIEKKDEKGTYWLSAPVINTSGACEKFKKRHL